MAYICILLNKVHHLQTIHLWHHHIGDNEVGHISLCYLQAMLTIGSLKHLIAVGKDTHEECPEVGIVFNHQNAELATFGGWHRCVGKW